MTKMNQTSKWVWINNPKYRQPIKKNMDNSLLP